MLNRNCSLGINLVCLHHCHLVHHHIHRHLSRTIVASWKGSCLGLKEERLLLLPVLILTIQLKSRGSVPLLIFVLPCLVLYTEYLFAPFPLAIQDCTSRPNVYTFIFTLNWISCCLVWPTTLIIVGDYFYCWICLVRIYSMILIMSSSEFWCVFEVFFILYFSYFSLVKFYVHQIYTLKIINNICDLWIIDFL